MPKAVIAPDSYEEIDKRLKSRWRKMSSEEKRQTFVDAGILTKTGRVTKRYQGVLVASGK